MQITGIESFKVRVPAKHGVVNSPQWGPPVFDQVPKFILRISTDEGIVGLGETARGVPQDVVDQGISSLLGEDPMEMNLRELSLPAWNRAYNAFEMAIFDIVGKVLGVPVWRLLGGAFRDRVEVNYWCGRMTPEDIAEAARKGAELGFKGIKMKCALEDPMVERVKAIAEAVPDMTITIDPNTRFYRPVDALKLARELEGYNVACFEDPVPKWNLDWYALIRQQTTIPLALHLGEPTDVINAIKREAVDYFDLGGSMANFVKMADIADAAGIPCWHGSGGELGIGDMSYVHACAAAKGCTLPSDILGNLLRQDDLIVEPIKFEDGCALVPQEPGLGVELDEVALEKYGIR